MKTRKDIKGYEGVYRISNYGEVQRIPGFTMKTKLSNSGYLQVALRLQGTRKFFSVHRLVAEMFIPNVENLPCTNHKDGNKLNNRVSNLEWCDHAYNLHHAYTTGLRVGPNKKKVIQLDLQGKKLNEFGSITDASKRTGVSQTCIRDVCKGRNKTAGGFKWDFVSR